jgi:hypothetical protein
VNGIFFQDRIVLLQFQSLSSIFAILRANITAHTGLTRRFVLGTFQNDLNPIAFFCHDRSNFLFQYEISFRLGFFQNCGNAMLIDGFNCFRTQFQRDPLILLRDKETFFLKIRVKSAFGLVISVGNIVSNLRPFSSYLTNSRHNSALCLIPLFEKGLQISVKCIIIQN